MIKKLWNKIWIWYYKQCIKQIRKNTPAHKMKNTLRNPAPKHYGPAPRKR